VAFGLQIEVFYVAQFQLYQKTFPRLTVVDAVPSLSEDMKSDNAR
jgi:hypothetical protein